jgi:hypothetical protein
MAILCTRLMPVGACLLRHRLRYALPDVLDSDSLRQADACEVVICATVCATHSLAECSECFFAPD